MKSFNVTNEYDIQKEKYDRAWAEFRVVFKKTVTLYYNYWFGKGGRFFYYKR